jgi:hypothetical protein
LLLGLALVKFGNPVIMEKYVMWPTNIWEWLLTSWPVVTGYWMLAVVTGVGLVAAKWKVNAPMGLVALPLLWLVWEALAATQSEVPRLSWQTVKHFATCVICFYLGLFSLGHLRRLGLFWAGILAGLLVVIGEGFQQHFGGLEESRKYWLLYVYPTMNEMPPGLILKMTSTRIFSTLFYPNSLAGVLLLLLPVTLAVLWSLRDQMTIGARRFLVGVAAAGSLACMFWSGSKGGWLIMLLMGFVAAMFAPLARRTKLILIGSVLVLGLAGFFVKYSGFFKRGAPSVVARFDYWRAALQTVREKPLFGNGPGMFGKAYERRKKPESEMAWLAHNDYLEQASDSGLMGFLIYGAMVIGTLVYTWPKGRVNWVRLAVWLGVLGWAMQSLVEFGLYIPAIGWLAFAFMGWLLGQPRNGFDSRNATSYGGVSQ